MRAIAALRAVRDETRPEKVYGCEVWRDLDWLPDDEKAGAGSFGAVEYRGGAGRGLRFAGQRRQAVRSGDRRAAGWRMPRTSRRTARIEESALNFAMDLTPLVDDPELPIADYVLGFIDRFRVDVEKRIGSVA